jgi:hypothetical protein
MQPGVVDTEVVGDLVHAGQPNGHQGRLQT